MAANFDFKEQLIIIQIKCCLVLVKFSYNSSLLEFELSKIVSDNLDLHLSI